MLRQHLTEICLATKGRGFTDFTGQVADILRRTGMQTGVVNLLVRHTSASLLMQENADPEVRRDLERFFARLAPDGDPLLQHVSEGDDDMPAHIRTALTTVNLSIPFARGELLLGTWQGVYLWEHRTHPHRRTIAVHVLGE